MTGDWDKDSGAGFYVKGAAPTDGGILDVGRPDTGYLSTPGADGGSGGDAGWQRRTKAVVHR
jgi:hypothetical protein